MMYLADSERGALSVRCLIATVAIQRWKAQPELRERYPTVAELADDLTDQFHRDHGAGDYINLEAMPEAVQ